MCIALIGCQDGRVVKALDSNTSAVFQTCSHAARAGLSSALSDQLTGREGAEIPPRSWWSVSGCTAKCYPGVF